MKRASVFVHGVKAAYFREKDFRNYEIEYLEDYNGEPVSLTLPVRKEIYFFEDFPAFFEGLLPEGVQLEALLKQKKIDEKDFFKQILAVGEDLVGAVNVVEAFDD